MKAIAFSNNDIAVIAWTLGGKLNGCLGFAISRIDVQADTETRVRRRLSVRAGTLLSDIAAVADRPALWIRDKEFERGNALRDSPCAIRERELIVEAADDLLSARWPSERSGVISGAAAP